MNLAVNARDAMPGGGTLTIATDHGPARRGRASPAAAPRRAGELRRRSPCQRHRARAWTRRHRSGSSSRSSRRRKGARARASGLATVYGIVKQSGGDIRVDERAGLGLDLRASTFRASDEPDASVAATARRPTARRRRAETVLLAEDEDRPAGSQRPRASRPADTGCSRRRTPPRRSHSSSGSAAPADLLVTDVVMPGASGRELARRLRDRHPGLKVLYVSGYAEDARVWRRRELPAEALHPGRLSERVAELLTTEVRRS